jgi:hypothetical protein
MTTTADKLRQNIAAKYAALGISQQIIALVKLGERLSFLARDTYSEAGGVANGPKLRLFNEAQHRIFVQLSRMSIASMQRYPDDVFANILADQFAQLDLSLDDLDKIVGEA